MDKKEKVGYKNPPKEHQFKKGQSGNPKGRPPKQDKIRFKNDILELVMEEAREEVSLNIQGSEVTMPFIKAIIKRLKMDALKGDFRSKKLFISMVENASAEEHEQYEELLKILWGLATDLDSMTDEELKAKGTSAKDLFSMIKSLEQYKKDRYGS